MLGQHGALCGHQLTTAVDRAGAALAAEHRPRRGDEGKPAVAEHGIAQIGRDIDAQTCGPGCRGDHVRDGVLELADPPEARRQGLCPIRQIERAPVVGQHDGCTAADVELVHVARQTFFEARRVAEARVQQLAVLGTEDGEDDVDIDVGQPVIQHVRVVVLVLREGDLQRADVGEPVEGGPTGGELRRPARDEQRVVEDHRVDVQPADRARHAVAGVPVDDLVAGGAGLQHTNLLAQRRSHRARRGVLIQHEHPSRRAPERQRARAAGLPQARSGHAPARRRMASLPRSMAWAAHGAWRIAAR